MLYVVLFSLIISSVAGRCSRVVCLIDNRNDPKDFIPDKVPKDYCTHIIYASADIEGNTLKNQFSYELNTKQKKGLYAKFTGLKRVKSDLKTLLRVTTPWGSAGPFSKMVSTKDNRKAFIENVIAFLARYKFDGLDIDWLYPTQHGGSSEDKPNFSAFLKEASEAFSSNSTPSGSSRFLLSATVHSSNFQFYDVPALGRYLDMVNVMTFMLRGPWDGVMDHHSPLFGNYGVVNRMGMWKHNGIPVNKLNIGVVFFGLYAHVQSKTDSSRGGRIVNVEKPLYTPYSSGRLPFVEICKLATDQNNVHWDESLKAPYFFKDGLWLGYDTVSSVGIKANIGAYYGYGFWIETLQLDDYNGTMCNMGKFPYTRHIFSGCGM
ncbi:unnamed protein product [Lymnaea stagnalis]|uniref:GH18 domain-containing protein n=1 Tax=Lymnaea stagnalis TaxID=6523 RepID=A0AAV2H5U6_LYMST